MSELADVLENSILTASGSVPIILDGIEHTYATATPMPKESVHECHELLCMRDGKIEMIIDGDKVTLDKGKMLIIRPFVKHRLSVRSLSADMFILYFGFASDKASVMRTHEAANSTATSDQTYEDGQKPVLRSGPSVEIPGNMAQVSLESFVNFVDAGAGDNSSRLKEPYFVMSGKDKREISSVVERIVMERNNNFYSKEVMLQTLTVELMIDISRALRRRWEESLQVRNGKADELVTLARQYMDENYDRGITVAEAAQYVFLSQGYFTRAFRDKFGVSPMSYLMQKRLDKACELLKHEDIKVSAVATNSGFSSSQRFNVAFRKYMNMTPLQYRKEYLRKTEEE